MSHDFDTGRKAYCRVAYGTPYRRISARYAAEQLLLQAFRDEWRLYDTPGTGAGVEQEGLLLKEDIRRIERAAFEEQESFV
jgi:hypothetical protein